MKEDTNDKYKKETGCLFYNVQLNKKIVPILIHIDHKKKKIRDIYSNIDNYYSNKNLTENEESSKDSYGYYRHIFSKYFSSQINKAIQHDNYKKKKPKKMPKSAYQLNRKIHFGSFLNTSAISLEGYKNKHKLEHAQNQLLKSNNFSFIKDPNTIRYKKLPLDLYLSKEDSIKIKNLISIRLMSKKNKKIDKSLVKFSYDNGIFDNNNLKDNIEQIKKSKIFFINENNREQKSIINLTEKNNLYDINNEKNIKNIKTTKKLIKKKYLSESNLTELNNIDYNITQKNSRNIYNKTEYQNVSLNKKKYILSELNQEIKNFSKYKTPEKEINDCIKLYKQKSETKMRKIDKLINKAKLRVDSAIMINDLKIYGNKKKKKAFQKISYSDAKKRIKFLSILEKLKNVQRLAPMQLLNNIYEEYTKMSKKIIANDSIKKHIENIYKSSEEGKEIKRKMNDKNYIINKIISKNHFDGIKLKNKYKQFDLVIDKINEENQIPPTNQ